MTPLGMSKGINDSDARSVNDTGVQPTLSNIFANAPKHCFWWGNLTPLCKYDTPET
jgi:hypothetical protein